MQYSSQSIDIPRQDPHDTRNTRYGQCRFAAERCQLLLPIKIGGYFIAVKHPVLHVTHTFEPGEVE